MDYLETNDVPGIDACSFHTYLDAIGGHPDAAPEETERWIRGHVADAHDRLGKPAYNGEWGYGVASGTERSDALTVRNEHYERYFDWFDQYDLDGSVAYHLDPGDAENARTYAIACPQDERTCELLREYGANVAEKSGSETAASES
ncbi:hypothetical protein [Salinarchaeum sp. Harcht-Bsk1]|uniref:hypothetical protein n=1 Tax=Salinarchaeum sp. Harcht-Bsk1 TaxID=1333523 RepID=UPI000677F9BC|nr:hypothetical protein [Salinarchaeum sp. Harcht-Bsk1]